MIVLEGIDSYKKKEIQSFLKRRLAKDSIIWPGFTGQCVVMSVFYKIPIDIDVVFEDEKAMNDLGIIFPVYLIANKKELVRKIRRAQIDIEIKDIDPILHIYKKYLIKTPFEYCLIDTAYKTSYECARIIEYEYLMRQAANGG